MHTFFENQGLVSRICITLQEQGSKDSLAKLARTSKLFTEPALDALWYELRGLKPLVMCMPKDSWKTIPAKNKRILTLNFARELQQSDLAVLYRYAKRVRVFYFGDYSRDEDDYPDEDDESDDERDIIVRAGQDIHDILSHLCDNNTFSNLQKLYWGPQYGCLSTQKPLPQLFTSEKIHTFILVLDMPENEMMKKLDITNCILFNCRTNLRHLEFHFNDLNHLISSTSFAAEISEVIALCQNLTTLKVETAMTSNIITHLASLSNLQSLNIGKLVDIKGLDEMIRDIQANIEVPFPSLLNLHMRTNLEGILVVLPLIKSSTLQEIVIVVLAGDSDVNINTWKILVSGITRIGYPMTLHTLAIIAPCYSEDLGFQATIGPFLCFQNLRKFSIKLSDNIFINPHEVEMLTRSWPHLKSFFVHGTTTTYESLSMNGLITLAMTCTKLEELEISFTDSIPNRVNTEGTSSKLQYPGTSTSYQYNPSYKPYPRFKAKNRAHTFDVGYSRINDEEYVFELLALLFPSIKILTWDMSVLSREHCEVWHKIRGRVYQHSATVVS